jgi:hypothetical protein
MEVYWTIREELLVLQWLTANTQGEQSRVYLALVPKINRVIEHIMQRYFSIPVSQQTILKKECVNEVFLGLYKYNSTKQRAFAFVGMLAKHFIYTQVVLKPKTKKQIMFDNNYGDTEFENAREIYYENKNEVEIESELKEVINFFKNKRKEIEIRMKTIKYDKKRNRIITQKNELILVDLSIEFLQKFKSLNIDAMGEYVIINSNISKNSAHYIFRKLFNVQITIFNDNFIFKRERKIDNNNNIVDDYGAVDGFYQYTYYRKQRKKVLDQKPDLF